MCCWFACERMAPRVLPPLEALIIRRDFMAVPSFL
jgi:hypothetical protein